MTTPNVTTWIVAPEDAGQMVEVAYGLSDDDGTPFRRITDRSARTTRYEMADGAVVGWCPENERPVIDGEWVRWPTKAWG